MFRTLMIATAWVLVSMPALGSEWEVDESDNFVIASITGNITNGEKQRFVFFKGNCERVNHIFSTYTTLPGNFDELKSAILVIEFNGEEIGAKVLKAKKAMLGHLLMFDLGTYDKNMLLKHLETKAKITIRFVDGNGYKASEYFDVPYNEWHTLGISAAFDRAGGLCRGIPD